MCTIYRSPPRTRRSSTSSTGSSGNGGYSGGLSLTSGGLATAKRASRRRSRSPSPRPTAKLSAPMDAGRRSRSPTPRRAADHLTVGNVASRSRSVTPSGSRTRRSASPSSGACNGSGCDRLLHVPNGPQRQPNDRSRSPSVARQRSGVDDTPTPKISLNFTPELAAELGDRLQRSSRESSVDIQREPGKMDAGHNGDDGDDDDDDDDVSVDTSSTCRVSDNFRGTGQYHVLNPTPVTAIGERRHSTVREEESVVDTTPFSRVSDSLRVAAYDCPSATAGRKKSHTSRGDVKKSEPVGTDSGSEVSDEGYRSLGVVASPPSASNVKNVQKFNGKHHNICEILLGMLFVRAP